jgi:putative ABC transport system permease protein
MRLIRILRDRFRALFGRDIVADEIREEIQFHLEERIREHERRGLSPEAAREAARQKFGNAAVVRDRGYDVRGGGLMESLMQDMKYAVRLLTKQRGFTAVALVTLALGTGLTTALFTVIDAAVLRPLPFKNPEQLVELNTFDRTRGIGGLPVSLADLADARARTHVFSHVATSYPEWVVIVDGTEPERLSAKRVSADYLPLLGVSPMLGRTFTAADEQPGAPATAILGHAYWQRRYNGDSSVIGRTIRFADGTATIVGITPASFRENRVLLQPLNAAGRPATRESRTYYGLARLQPGVTISRAETDLETLAQRIEAEHAEVRGYGFRITSFYEATTAYYWRTLKVLGAAVVLVLIIACVNVAGLQLTRGATRQGELAVRASLGAGRARLVRQLLIESLVLAGAGTLAGVALAWISLDVLVANIPLALPANAPVALDLRALAFAVVISLVSGLTFGVWPALRLSKTGLGHVLARSPRGQGAVLSRRTSAGLILIEVALAVVLVAGGALMLRSFARMTSVDVGFDTKRVVTMDVMPVEQEVAAFAAYYPALVARLRSIPGVETAGAINELPLGGGSTSIQVWSEGAAAIENRRATYMRQVLPGYLETVGLRLIAGRTLEAHDFTASPRKIVISELSAQSLYGGGPQALGRFVHFSSSGSDLRQIVGIVGDLRHRGAAERPRATVYVPYGQRPARSTATARPRPERMTAVVRTAASASAMVPFLRRAAQEAGQPAIVQNIRTGDELVSGTVSIPRQRTALLALLGALGLLLALVGVFGVTSYAVTRRTREIGVRMAFGAKPRDVVMTMVKDAGVPIALGIAVGFGGAWFLTQMIATFLYETTPRDPLTFALVAIVLGIGGTLAAWIPARKAARVDPVVALRAD